MRKIFITCALAVIAVSMASCAFTKAQADVKNAIAKTDTVYINADFDGLYFDIQAVTQEFSVGATAHYIVYDDPDTNMDNEVIRVTESTYKTIVGAIKAHKYFTGRLKPTCTYESIEYELTDVEQYAVAIGCADK